MVCLFKSMWRWQHAFLRAVIGLQNWVLMALVYVVAIAPVAVVMKFLHPNLLYRGESEEGRDTHWIPRDDEPMDMERARRMF
jgi:hypothetical protein